MKILFSILLAAVLFVSSVVPVIGSDINNSSQESTKTKLENEDAVSTLSLTAKDLIELDFKTFNQTVPAGANDFALRLTSRLIDSSGEKNFVFSPFSVWLPLVALVNGTDQAHKEKLLNTLGIVGISESDLNPVVSQMLYRLTYQKGKEYVANEEEFHNPLQIVNAIFVDDKVTLKREFAQTLLDFYNGTAFNVDFASDSAAKIINKWASDNTEGLITDIIQKFDPLTVAAIANAIYFSDRWQWEFNADDTKSDVFHTSSGDTQAEFMLHEGNSQLYYEDDKVQAMPLNFKTGANLHIIKPKNGDANGLLKSLTTDYLSKINKEATAKTGKLLLPKFEIDSGLILLADTLNQLGVPLFNGSDPILSGVIEEYPLFISNAVQKAVIKVDEKGTTAAAVTVMMMNRSSLPMPTEPFEMICNSPFVFVLSGGGGEILFTGVVNQP
jgi:serpin B